jgi:threonine/homoserine/homoserine lactone efflux protein
MIVDLLSLLAVLTLGLLSPGPDFLLVLKNSVGGTRGRAFATVAGIALGLVAQMAAIAIGFTAMTPAVVRVVQLGGAAFLAWIGVRTLLAARASSNRPGAAPRSADTVGSAFLEGLGCNLTNPKAFLFYVSLYAQLVRPDTPAAWRALLPVLFVAHAVVTWSLVVLALRSPPVGARLARAQRWLPWSFGLALLALAAWTAWQAWPHEPESLPPPRAEMRASADG